MYLYIRKMIKYIKRRRISVYISSYLITLSLRIAKFDFKKHEDDKIEEEDKETLKNNQTKLKININND